MIGIGVGQVGAGQLARVASMACDGQGEQLAHPVQCARGDLLHAGQLVDQAAGQRSAESIMAPDTSRRSAR